MVDTVARRLESDLHLNPRVFVPILFFLGFAVLVLGESIPRLPMSPEPAVLSMICYALAMALWALCSWKEEVGRWSTVAALCFVAAACCWWLFGSLGAPLMLLAVGLATPLVGLWGSVTAGLVFSISLFLLPRSPFTDDIAGLVIILFSLGSSLGILIILQRPVEFFARWYWESYQESRRALDQARDRQAELKQALEELAIANRQLVLLNEHLAGLRAEAEQAQRTKTAFLSKVSHEFRTPLNMIIGLTDLLIESPEVYGEKLPSRLREHLEIVNRNCQHLSSLVNDVLDLSQTESGLLTLHRERMQVRELINKGLEIVAPLAKRKGLWLKTNVPNDLPSIYCDRTRIAQVVVNLLSNSARYTETGGVFVSASQDGDEIMIAVKDTGPGIPPEDRSVIFEPFCQGTSRTQRDRDGSGLGLSISKQFVELHGGRIWFESELGMGSTFHFSLPIDPPAPSVGPPGHWILSEWEERSSHPRSGIAPPKLENRVVVLDPANGLAPMLSRLPGDVGFTVVSTSKDACAEIKRCPANLVLLNCRTPDELCRMTQELHLLVPHTSIIGACFRPVTERAISAGAHGYLIKPISRNDLQGVLSKAGGPRNVLVVDDEPDDLELFALQLRAIDPEIEVHTALDGNEALGVLQSKPCDLVLLDIVMPELDGWQMLARKQSDPRIADIPTWMISAEDPAERPPRTEVVLAAPSRGLLLERLYAVSTEMAQLMRG